MKTKMTDKNEVINLINTLKGYRGYVQFSHRPIDLQRDVFTNRDPSVQMEEGFVYEAHFASADTSIAIRQINGSWYVLKTDILAVPDEDVEIYASDIQGLGGVKMAQIWVEECDELCENMNVNKLKKVVFAGFEGGEV